jgi:hypothetical protein
MPELERTLVESGHLQDRFHPHPSLAGAHLLDWNGQMQPVTFDPAVYDEHPNTVCLLTYGSDLLAEILAVVEPPADTPQGGQLARCWAGSPVERVGWYAVTEQPTRAIRSLSRLREAVASTATGTPPDSVAAAVCEQFNREMAPIREQEARILQTNERSRAEGLAEEVRDLLLQAAYIELLKAAAEGMFATDGGAGFSVETVRRLRRHKFPFAGALKAVAVDGLKPSATDPKYVKLAQTRPDQLDRRFEAVKNRIAEVLPLYVAAAEGETKAAPAPVGGKENQVSLYRVSQPPSWSKPSS